MMPTRYQLSYRIVSLNEINNYTYLICLSPNDEELDKKNTFIIIVVYLHITCLFTIQQKENDKEELHKK